MSAKFASITTMGSLASCSLSGHRASTRELNRVSMGAFSANPAFSNLSKDGCSFLAALLHPDPLKRLNTQNVMRHEFFREINWAAVRARKLQPPWDTETMRQLAAKRLDEAFEQRRTAAKVLGHLMQKEEMQNVSNFDFVSPRAIMEEYLENVYQLRAGPQETIEEVNEAEEAAS